MPEHSLPEFDALFYRLKLTVADAIFDIGDFRAALDASNLPQTIAADYESRKQLRRASARTRPATNGKQSR